MMKPVSIRVLTSLVVPLAGLPFCFALFFLVSRQLIRHDMEEKLEAGALQTLVMPADAIQWIEAGKELTLDGRLFDVESLRHRGDGRVEITGLFDEAEERLQDQLTAFMHQGDQGEANTSFARLFYTLVFLQPGGPADLPRPDAAARYYFATICSRILPAYTDAYTPPPENRFS